MWVPKSFDELEQAVKSGTVEESAVLDFKKELTSNSKELAKDISAMANDGGVLIYGVGEDAAKRPTELYPLKLKGLRERISEIVRTCIRPPLQVEISLLDNDLGDDGYVVIAVPTSPSAPHMVTVGGDNRYYGRCAGGNCRLEEGEISRLYERRQRWEVDREQLLDLTIKAAPYSPQPDLAFIHIFAKPVAVIPSLLRTENIPATVYAILNEHPGLAQMSPSFSSPRPSRLPNGWRFQLGADRSAKGAEDSFEFDLLHDGSSRLFFGRAGARPEANRPLTVFPVPVRNIVMVYLFIIGCVYHRSKFYGQLDLGAAITGIEGGLIDSNSFSGRSTGFAGESARDTTRAVASLLAIQFPIEISKELLFQFCHGFGLDAETLFSSKR